MKKKIVIVSSFLCLGLATCQFHFENDQFDLTLEGVCDYENAQENASPEGQKSFFKNCNEDFEKE